MDTFVISRQTARRITDFLTEKSEDIDGESELAKTIEALASAFDSAQGMAGNNAESVEEVVIDIHVRGGDVIESAVTVDPAKTTI